MTDTERKALKDIFDENRFELIANDVAAVWRPFDIERFLAVGLHDHAQLSLLQRLRLVSIALRETLPPVYPEALDILFKLATRTETGFVSLFLPDFVGRYGQDNFELSMQALKSFTRLPTASFCQSNPAFTEITGYPAQEAIGQTPRLLRSNRHAQEFHAGVWQQITEAGQWKGEIWNRRKNGEIFVAWQTITLIAGLNGEAGRFVAVFHDITESWHKNEHTKHLAFHDALTDLPNRSLLMERLERQIAIKEREPRCLAVLFLDLDRFKFVNDTQGHAIGDDLLVAVAQKLQALVRQSDTVARLGGDEFVIMLDNPANGEEVVQIAKRIIAVINEPMEFHGKTAQVGTSIGIAIYPVDGATAAELLKNADTAMYEAKHAGKNTYRFFASKALIGAAIEKS